MKRGQIAIFAFLGMVLLAIVFFMLYIVTSVNLSEVEQRAQNAVRDYLAISPINLYVNLCLERATKQAIQELTMQGGTLFESQQGPFMLGDEGVTHIPYNISEDETINVTYGILRPYNNDDLPQVFYPQVCEVIETNPPLWPIPQTNFSQMTMNNFFNSCYIDSWDEWNTISGGYLGVNLFSKACHNESVNLRTIQIGGTQVLGCRFTDYRSVTSQKNHSLEYVLSNRILNKTIDCIDFKLFEDMDGDNIQFLPDANRDVKVFRSPGGINVELTLPFRVALRGHVPVVTRYAFGFSENIRLFETHGYLYELLRKDSIYPLFNLSSQYSTNMGDATNLFLQGFELEIIDFEEGEKIYKWDRILKLTDNLSEIFGENLTYYVAIQNRNPVLEYINPSPHPDLNIIVYNNQTITIDPFGIDPDDRSVSYAYSNWRETNLSILNSSCSFENIQQLKNCMDITPCPDCENWTNSQDFQDTLKRATYTPNSTETGYFEVRVHVQDPSGKVDYQDVKILVIDMPQINIEIQNRYPLSVDHLSIENPIFFNGSASLTPSIISGDFSDVIWRLRRLGTVIKTYNTDNPNLIIPPNYNILNISNQIPSVHGNYGMNVSMTFTPQDETMPQITISEDYEFEVKQCVPHRSDSPTFPYHTIVNPFLANHSCCDDYFNYLNDLTICYEEQRWGTHQALIDRARDRIDIHANQLEEVLDITPSITFTGDEIIASNLKNNLFTLIFERACDGTRGNICAGNITYSIDQTQDCGYNEPLLLQCSGPPNNFISSSSLSCTNYGGGEGFNTSIQQIVNGLCQEGSAPSGWPNEYNNTVGPLTCNGAVCSGGDCRNVNNPLVSCQCDVSLEEAECDEHNLALIEGDQCRRGCNVDDFSASNACLFTISERMPCDQSEGNYCFRNDNVYNDQPAACYFDVACTVEAVDYHQEICDLGQFIGDDDQVYCRYLQNPDQPCHNTNSTCNVREEVQPSDNYICHTSLGWRPTLP